MAVLIPNAPAGRIGGTPPQRADALHVPFEQNAPEAHGFVHAPQWAGSSRVSVHNPSHKVSPTRHPQVPPLHVSFPAHAFPQVPQLPGSLSGSTQLPWQGRKPAAQTHAPR
jgi:hypothetical protein